ncbi:hypothetical protein AAZX31_02G169800 [Glycine max]
MKNLRQNLEVRATIPVKLGKKSTWEVLFPRRLWLPMWTFDQRKEGKLKLKRVWVWRFGRGLFSVFCHSPAALAESLTVAFPVSRAPEIFCFFNAFACIEIELVVFLLSWKAWSKTFVDPKFNHQDWDLKLQQTMVEMFPLNSADATYTKLRGMLSTLGDPFTRIISPKEYQGFRIGSDGNVQGVGLFINVEPRTGHLTYLDLPFCSLSLALLMVNFCRRTCLVSFGGILPFQLRFFLSTRLQLETMLKETKASERLDGIDSETAAQRLRGNAGTTVTVKVKDSGTSSWIREVKLPRDVIIPRRSPDGHLTKTGYVKLSAFPQTAAEDLRNAIQELENQGFPFLVILLHGGLVKVGLDVTQMWLYGNKTLVNTIDKDGNMLPINMVDGHAITHDPLVVIVINEGGASASEILAGALHDNGLAILVGHKTFGKGKIQCTTTMLNSAKEISSLTKDKALVSSLEADSCIMVAEHELDLQESKRIMVIKLSS